MKKSLAARSYRAVANAIEPFIPRGLVTPAHYLSRRLTGRLEAEFGEIMAMTRPGRTVVDVGANIGIYTYGFLERGASVVAIEPQKECADLISAFYKSGFPRSAMRGSLDVRVEALGAEAGRGVLHIPLKNGRRDDESATLEALAGDSIEVAVPVTPLDDLQLDNVQIIKMDVEGHEIGALTGAAQTIRNSGPAILVEIEQRHHSEPISDVFHRIETIIGSEYSTWFLGRDHKLKPISEFDIQRQQLALMDNPLHPDYVRNFFFLYGR